MADMKINEMVEILQEPDLDCLIVDKVFASCQQRECFPQVEAEIECDTYERIRFRPGFIVPNTLVITDTDTPNFRRARFTVRIPYQVIGTNGEILFEGFLPDILKDIILYIPDARDEFEFRIVVETMSELLAEPIRTGNTLTFTVGTFIIIKVVGTVQLIVPAYGYCPEPPPCTEFSPDDICDEFEYADFPEFFPPQLEV